MAARKSIEQMHESHWKAHERASSIGDFRAWIGGEARDTGETIETRDPAIDYPIVEVASCDAAAVDAAREAVDGG